MGLTSFCINNNNNNNKIQPLIRHTLSTFLRRIQGGGQWEMKEWENERPTDAAAHGAGRQQGRAASRDQHPLAVLYNAPICVFNAFIITRYTESKMPVITGTDTIHMATTTSPISKS